jgi:hypothetical protein
MTGVAVLSGMRGTYIKLPKLAGTPQSYLLTYISFCEQFFGLGAQFFHPIKNLEHGKNCKRRKGSI